MACSGFTVVKLRLLMNVLVHLVLGTIVHPGLLVLMNGLLFIIVPRWMLRVCVVRIGMWVGVLVLVISVKLGLLDLNLMNGVDGALSTRLAMALTSSSVRLRIVVIRAAVNMLLDGNDAVKMIKLQ